MIAYEETDLRLLKTGTIVQRRIDQYGNEKPLLVARVLYIDEDAAEAVRQCLSDRWRTSRGTP